MKLKKVFAENKKRLKVQVYMVLHCFQLGFENKRTICVDKVPSRGPLILLPQNQQRNVEKADKEPSGL